MTVNRKWLLGERIIPQHQKYQIGDRFNLKYGAAQITETVRVSDGRIIYILGYDEGGPKYPAAFSQDSLEAHMAELKTPPETQE